MNIDLINVLVGLLGGIVGAGGMYIAVKKMPHEIGQSDSTTIKNLADTIETLSTREKNNTEQIAALNAIIHGTFEVRTFLRFANPPEVIHSQIRMVDSATAEADHA